MSEKMMKAIFFSTFVCFFIFCSLADAGQLSSVSLYNDYNNFAKNDPGFNNTGAVRVESVTNPGLFEINSSGTAIGGRYVLGSAHSTNLNANDRFAIPRQFILADNFNSPTPNQIYNIVNVIIHPSFVRNNWFTVDAAIFELDRDIENFTPLAIGSVQNLETIKMAGFGSYGDLNTGLIPSQGDILGGNATIRNDLFNSSSFSSDLYFASLFSTFRQTDINAAGGDSGSTVLNSMNQFAGMPVAATIGFGTGGLTHSLRLDNPQVQEFISPYLAAVPEPSTLGVLGVASLCLGVYGLRKRK